MLHDALMRAATSAKVQVSTNTKLAPGALRHTAALMWPRLEEQRGAARRKQLLEGLQVRGGGVGLGLGMRGLSVGQPGRWKQARLGGMCLLEGCGWMAA